MMSHKRSTTLSRVAKTSLPAGAGPSTGRGPARLVPVLQQAKRRWTILSVSSKKMDFLLAQSLPGRAAAFLHHAVSRQNGSTPRYPAIASQAARGGGKRMDCVCRGDAADHLTAVFSNGMGPFEEKTHHSGKTAGMEPFQAAIPAALAY